MFLRELGTIYARSVDALRDEMKQVRQWSQFGFPRRLTAVQNLPLITVRCKSLSAIHRGLRESQRGPNLDSSFDRQFAGRRSDDGGGRDSRGRSSWLTGKAMKGSASSRQQHKLRKKLGRKAEEDENEDGGKQTRRKRFLDPDSTFGKRSLVYQLKHGPLKEMAEGLKIKEFVKPRPFPSTRRDMGERRREPRREPRERFSENQKSDTRQRPFHRDTRVEEDGGERMEAFPTRKKMMPMTVKYTTAASQFLYGKSVVKSALEHGRRKLYNLYIYGGENRKESKENAVMERLARQQGVPVTIVPNDEQRLMDKMSMGRPHNGFVLETSPLPVIPILSLGRLEETSQKVGFHVARDHQSREEESVNGTSTFVPRASDNTAKPFVLLLNEILDPGNLGGLLRTASYLGVDAVGITNRSSATLTPVVLKSAAGAVEEVAIFTVDDPVRFIEDSKQAGWKSYAAVAPPERKLIQMHEDKFINTGDVEANRPLSQDPCILVLGNEGFGLSKQIKVAADYELSIPRFMTMSSVDSLNVSVAAGILCHAFVREPVPEPVGKSGERLPEGDSSPDSSGELLY